MREKQRPRRMKPEERRRKLTDASLRDRCLVVATAAHLKPPAVSAPPHDDDVGVARVEAHLGDGHGRHQLHDGARPDGPPERHLGGKEETHVRVVADVGFGEASGEEGPALLLGAAEDGGAQRAR